MTTLTFEPVRRQISSITTANPAVVGTTEDHGYSDGLYVRVVLPENFGMSQLNDQVFLIDVLSDTTFSLGISSIGMDAFVSGSDTITGISQAFNAVVSTSGNNFLSNQMVIISDVSGMTQINNRMVQILSVGSNSIIINLDTRQYDAYTSGGAIQVLQTPQVIPVAEVSSTLANATRNNLTPIGG